MIDLKDLQEDKKDLYIFVSSIFAISILVIGANYIGGKNKKSGISNDYGQRISERAYQAEYAKQLQFYRVNNQKTDDQTIRSQAANRVAEDQIIQTYAAGKKIKVQKKEVDDLYDLRIKSMGSEERLLSEVNRLYGMDEQAYRSVLAKTILRDKVQATLPTPLADWLKAQR